MLSKKNQVKYQDKVIFVEQLSNVIQHMIEFDALAE